MCQIAKDTLGNRAKYSSLSFCVKEAMRNCSSLKNGMAIYSIWMGKVSYFPIKIWYITISPFKVHRIKWAGSSLYFLLPHTHQWSSVNNIVCHVCSEIKNIHLCNCIHRWGRRLACLSRDLLLDLRHKKKVYGWWK